MSFVNGHITGPLMLTACYRATQEQMPSLVLVFSLNTNSQIPNVVTFQSQTLNFLLSLFVSNSCGFAFRSESVYLENCIDLSCFADFWFGLVGGWAYRTYKL